MSCQILIKGKLAKEYHFSKQTGQVFHLVLLSLFQMNDIIICYFLWSCTINVSGKMFGACFPQTGHF